MTITLQYLDDLSRVRISLSGWPNGAVHVQRALNANATDALWSTVRGGLSLPVVGGEAVLDDYEFAADVENHYRVKQARWDDMAAIFTSSGTWTKPSGLVAVRVTVVGGGGAGGGATTTNASESSVGTGGGGGGAAIAWIAADDLGATETVTVGAGGAPVAGGDGGDGGTSSFGSHCVATGGSGGLVLTDDVAAAISGPAGGVGTAGDVLIRGDSGGMAICISFPRGGEGGGSLLGGKSQTATSNSNVGVAGAQYGGGGSGGNNAPSQGTARAGGPGAPGIVIVEHFFDEIGV